MRINSIRIIGLVAVTLGTALLGLNGGAARADIEPERGTPTVFFDGTDFVWTYAIEVTKAQKVENGDFFTIYDFDGFQSATFDDTKWKLSTSFLTGPVSGTTQDIVPADEASIENYTFTYIGDDVIFGPQSLGSFVLKSEFGKGSALRSFVGRGTDQDLLDIDNDGIGDVIKNANGATMIAPGVIPEPGEYAFAAFAGASLLGLVVRARRRTGSAAA